MNPPVQIDADDLVIKRWEPQWAPEAAAAVIESLPEFKPYLPWATDGYGIEDSRTFLQMSADKWDKGEEFNYAIFDRAGTLVGSIGLMTRMGPGTLEIGYWIRTSHAGRGYMTTAVKAMADVALAQPGIEKAIIRHDPRNAASAAVAAKAGFTVAGQLPVAPVAPAGTEPDVIRERRV